MVYIYGEHGSPRHGQIQELIVDSMDDLMNLLETDRNLAMGSVAFVIAEMCFYILNGDREWVKVELKA